MALPRKIPIEVNGVTHWYCSSCAEFRPNNMFYKCARAPNGLGAACKDCVRITKNKWRAKNKKRHSENSKRYYLNRGSELNIRYRRANPQKIVAGVAARYAIKVGWLVRPSKCSRCGTAGSQIVAHHPDYTKPLRIEWVCPPCHYAVHHEE